MAILKIARMGHPVLGRPAEPVHDPSAPEIRRLGQDMVETMRDADGTGLAAPQVHVPKRVVIFTVAADRGGRGAGEGSDEEDALEGDAESAAGGVPLTVLINPQIVALDDRINFGWEACLSVPGLAGQVPRHTAIRYSGFGLDGRQIDREAHGFHARVVQHECDHLDGMLYPQRMTDLSTLVFTSEMKHLVENGEPVPPVEE